MKSADCWRLIWSLPHRHPIKTLHDAAIHGPYMPSRIRQQAIRRCLKWAYKQRMNPQITLAQAIIERRQIHWRIIRRVATLKITGRQQSRHYLNQLRSLPRDNKPLPLP